MGSSGDRWKDVLPTLTVAVVGLAFIVVMLVIGAAVTGTDVFGWNLSTFVPDLLVALVTGAVITGGVFALESRARTQAGQQAAREAALDGWALASSDIFTALRDQMFWVGWESNQTPIQLTDANSRFNMFRLAMGRYPLASWARAVPDSEEICAVARVAAVMLEYDLAARRVESLFDQPSVQAWGSSSRVRLTEAIVYRGTLEKLKTDGDHTVSWSVFKSPEAAELIRVGRELQAAWVAAREALGVKYIS